MIDTKSDFGPNTVKGLTGQNQYDSSNADTPMQDYSRSRRRKQRSSHTSRIFLLSNITKFAFFGLLAAVIFGVVLFFWYSRDLPTPGKLVEAQTDQSTRIYDRKNTLLYSVYQKNNRTYVTLDKIPKFVQEGTIAIEDKNFYQNQGFDVMGYFRIVRNILIYHQLTGGSTLTQQLVKNVLLSSERTLPRKIKELILAIQVDKTYTKNQIIEMYLNDVPYGGTAIGVEAASEQYFGKHVNELDLAQSAFLSGLPQSPTTYSPFSGNKYYLNRTQEVLSQMEKSNYITQKEVDAAYGEIKNYKFSQNDLSIKAPHFVMYVKSLLVDKLHFTETSVQNGGLQVTTTLDYDIQKQAEDIVKEEIDKLKGYRVSNGAAVVADPKTGEILAMIGSKDYFDKDNSGNFNVAISQNRQPGSSLKPITYAVAFEKNYTPATMVMDLKTEFPTGEVANPTYIPVNYDGKYHGPVQLRFALGNSLNIPAVKMLARVGVKDVMQKAYDMGIENWQPTSENMRNVGLSLVLGGRGASLLNEVTAYSVFATGGVRHDPIGILKVTDSKGKTLYEAQSHEGQRVLSPEVSFLISHILLDNEARKMEFGPSSYLVIPGKTVSVKTGTTDNKKDNWTIGYTPSYVVGVWVGNNDNSPMNQAIASGVTGASPIWNRIMTAVLKGKSDEQPAKPDTVNALKIDALSGGLPHDNDATRVEYFIKGTEPTGLGPIYQKVKVSKHDNNKLANADEISHGDYDSKDFIVFAESDPVSTDGKNRWQDAINAWLTDNYKDDKKYHPPTETADFKYSGDNNANSNPTKSPTPSISPSPTN